ncbi:MAG: aldolase/citrate lyase family protein [Hyphomicrobiales bacterium]|nr:aldolase/citrate lyase family protein [Hyphomicrobiales bacterium]
MQTNTMKQKILNREPAFGLSIMFASPQLVEMAAGCGFDWVLIDCEHGAISLESVEVLCMAAKAAGITPIARPRSKDALEILQVLDRGALGVQIPHVNTADEARAAVKACKFHPDGMRSLAGGTRPQNYDLPAPSTSYYDDANREILVCVQLEDKIAIDNADEILAVEGIDVFFIGPSDLSQTYGHPGNPKAEPVAKAVDETLAKIVAAGKAPGMPAAAAAVEDVRAKGVLYIYTHVPRLLGSAAADYFKATKGG